MEEEEVQPRRKRRDPEGEPTNVDLATRRRRQQVGEVGEGSDGRRGTGQAEAMIRWGGSGVEAGACARIAARAAGELVATCALTG